MKLTQLALSAALLFSAAHAKAACDDATWELKGNIEKEITTYNQFLKTLDAAKDPIVELNTFLKAHGLPLQLAADKIKGFENRLDYKDDELGGPVVVVFLKTMKVPSSSGLSFDSVHEFENSTATKQLRQWNIPFNDSAAAIEKNDLIFETKLIGICGGKSRAVSVAVQPDGAYRVINFKKDSDLAGKEIKTCAGTKTAFKHSAYATCREFSDLKTKKKRLLIWQLPQT